MSPVELTEVVEQRMTDPTVVGCLVTNLRNAQTVEQRHHDGTRFGVEWKDCGDYWRCTISTDGNAAPVAKVDLHDNCTVRVQTFTPCRLTISPEEGFLCLTR